MPVIGLGTGGIYNEDIQNVFVEAYAHGSFVNVNQSIDISHSMQRLSSLRLSSRVSE